MPPVTSRPVAFEADDDSCIAHGEKLLEDATKIVYDFTSVVPAEEVFSGDAQGRREGTQAPSRSMWRRPQGRAHRSGHQPRPHLCDVNLRGGRRQW